jgi:hypothetical protein
MNNFSTDSLCLKSELPGGFYSRSIRWEGVGQ